MGVGSGRCAVPETSGQPVRGRAMAKSTSPAMGRGDMGTPLRVVSPFVPPVARGHRGTLSPFVPSCPPAGDASGKGYLLADALALARTPWRSGSCAARAAGPQAWLAEQLAPAPCDVRPDRASSAPAPVWRRVAGILESATDQGLSTRFPWRQIPPFYPRGECELLSGPTAAGQCLRDLPPAPPAYPGNARHNHVRGLFGSLRRVARSPRVSNPTRGNFQSPRASRLSLT
jgi:hypothetical protein